MRKSLIALTVALAAAARPIETKPLPVCFCLLSLGWFASDDVSVLNDGCAVAVVDAGDRLAPEALYEVARSTAADAAVEALYTDEDQAGEAGERQAPRFKPAWSPDLLLDGPYVGRLAFLRVDLMRALEGFREGIDGSEEWDLWLRASRRRLAVRRIPLVLYHRHHRHAAPAQPPASAARVLADRCAESGTAVDVQCSSSGHWRVSWQPPRQPLVSIIVPNRNAAAIMRQCATGVLDQTAYPSRELIIVDNGSTEAATLQLYAELTGAGRARVVPFDRPFNFSAACNAGAAAARGELLLFLNNDIEVIEPGWLDDLVGWGMRPEIGVVGAQLLYPDRTIQHAGVVVGLGLVGHLFARAEPDAAGLFGSPASYRDCLAVTGACQLMRREVFAQLGGFDERFRISFSDVVLCLAAWTAGYRVVYTPYARLIHHESYTRERDDAPQDKKLLATYLRANGFEDDPYFHPELNPRSTVPDLRPAYEPTAGAAVREVIERTLAANMGAR